MKTIKKMIFYENLFPFVQLIELAKEKAKKIGWINLINKEFSSAIQDVKISYYEQKLVQAYKSQACPHGFFLILLILKQ